MNYVAQWRYQSSLGQFERGDVIQLDEAEAAAYNRDSPGVLVAQPDVPATKPVPPDAPPMDRMIKAAPKKRGKGA